MSEVFDPLAWVCAARRKTIELARSALRRKAPLTYGGCFHAQQCAEKYLKAILVARETPFGKVHDLLLLSEQCEEAGVLVPVDPRLLHRLSDYAVFACGIPATIPPR